MEGIRTAAAGTGQKRRSGKTVEGYAGRAQWCSLDFAHWSSLAGLAQTLSAVPDLSSAFSAMAAEWSLDGNSAIAVAGSNGSRQARPGRRPDRRFLQRSEKRGSKVGKTKCGKGSKIMAIADGHGLPIAVYVASASPHETKLVEPTLQSCCAPRLPKRLIGDLAYDSDPLDQELRQNHGVELIAPHKKNRSKAKTQDGRAFRRYRRRWKIERLFAWLHNFRRVVTRWEYHDDNFFGMVQLACVLILLKRYL
jgi:transposase